MLLRTNPEQFRSLSNLEQENTEERIRATRIALGILAGVTYLVAIGASIEADHVPEIGEFLKVASEAALGILGGGALGLAASRSRISELHRQPVTRSEKNPA